MRACVLAVMLSGCATLTGANTLYCGAVGQVAVSVQDGTPDVDCDAAVALTKASLWLSKVHGAEVTGPWAVRFQWAGIGAGDALGQTDPEWRTLKVRQARAVLHEIRHAALIDATSREDAHAVMCRDGWDRVELEFGVSPNYCGARP